MTIRNLREFISKIKGILYRKKIRYYGRKYLKHNIIDFSGFLHKIVMRVKYESSEELFAQVDTFMNT